MEDVEEKIVRKAEVLHLSDVKPYHIRIYNYFDDHPERRSGRFRQFRLTYDEGDPAVHFTHEHHHAGSQGILPKRLTI